MSQLSVLNVWEQPETENFILSENILSIPSNTTSFNNHDEIRMLTSNKGLIYLINKSYIYIRLKYEKKSKSKDHMVLFEKNFFFHLFSNIKLEINGQLVDDVKNPGITGCIRHLLTNKAGALGSLGVSQYGKFEDTEEGCVFDLAIPLKSILGFCEFYHHPILFSSLQLTLTRSSSDSNAVLLPKDQHIKFILDHLSWEIPVLNVLPMIFEKYEKIAKDNLELFLPFRHFELLTYSDLPKTKNLTWNARTFLGHETPRYVVLCFQQKDNTDTLFINANVKSISVTLNNVRYPDGSVAFMDFKKKHFSVMYENYRKFQENFYQHYQSEPLITTEQFAKSPLFVIDTTKQVENEFIKTIDLMINVESDEPFADGVTLFALVIHDRTLLYTPGVGYIANKAAL